jgi:hypothetical protein
MRSAFVGAGLALMSGVACSTSGGGGSGNGTTAAATTGGTGTGGSSGGSITDAGCDVRAIAAQIATEAGIDCGDLQVPYGYPLGEDAGPLALYSDAGPFEQAVGCALSSQDAGWPFLLLTWQSGIDTGDSIAYVESPDGHAHLLTQSWRVPGCLTGVSEVDCAEFVAASLPSFFTATDAGIAELDCFAPMPSVTVCGGPCQR